MWIRTNLNPAHKEVQDSVVRSIAAVLNKRWIDVYDDLCRIGREEFNMPGSDSVFGRCLYENGFEPFLFPEQNQNGITVDGFCQMNKKGRFLIGTGNHMIAVVDGDYYDSWDSGKEIPSVFWKMKTEGGASDAEYTEDQSR